MLPPLTHPTSWDGALTAPAEVPADFAPPTEAIPSPDDSPEPDEYLKESVKAEELYARAIRELASGNERQAVVHLLRAAKLAETAREWYLAAIALHAVGDVFRTPAPPYDLERAFRMYRRAVAAYEQCGHFDEGRNLEYQVCCLRLWRSRELHVSFWMRLEMFLYWLVAGFGFRPLRILVMSVVMILAFAVSYWAADGIMSPDEEPVAGFGSAAYFSGATFLTIGYGDLLPAPHVRWLTIAEGLVGVTMISFFVVVLANRLRH